MYEPKVNDYVRWVTDLGHVHDGTSSYPHLHLTDRWSHHPHTSQIDATTTPPDQYIYT